MARQLWQRLRGQIVTLSHCHVVTLPFVVDCLLEEDHIVSLEMIALTRFEGNGAKLSRSKEAIIEESMCPN